MEQLPLQAHPHRNHRLFADDYLDHRAPRRAEWLSADARPLLELHLDQPVRAAERSHLRTNENPSYQIDFYIRHSGLPWGILTNGRHWWLYHRESSKDLDTYYEVDLPALIERGDPLVGLGAGGEPRLRARRERGAQGQVYDALEALAQGFLDDPDNALQPTPETMQAIHDKSALQNYLGDYQQGEAHLPSEEWLALLRKSQRKVALDLGKRGAQERLQREYQESLDKLMLLKARLAATDRLIDLIVYRLYGLTDDEIAIVGGGA